MIYLQLNDIHKAFGEEAALLDGISLQVVKGDKFGLVGPNGAGKTTILKIVLGDVLADYGTVTLSPQAKLGYVSQEDELKSDYPLFLAMLESHTELLELKSEMESLEPQVAAGDEKILERYGNLQQKWELKGGYTLDSNIKNVLAGLGFAESDFNRQIRNFSGGERNRAELAKVLLHSPDLLLLDEPTNHLDIESTVWLEEYLQRFEGALIVVSHDRVFLDHVVNKVVELNHGKLELYHGNFTTYCEERSERRRLQYKKYLEQQEEIERIQDFIARNIAGQKTKQAQSRRRALSRMERIDAPTADSKKARFKMQASRRSYQSILEVENLSFAYGDRVLFSDLDFKLERGQKVALIGRNGTGKTTLIKAIVGQLKGYEGTVEIGKNVDLEYFDQDLAMLNHDDRVIDTIWDIQPHWDAFTLRSHLARFLFFGDDVFKQVKMLSGGEKKKLALAWLLALPANFIILDEPTNHLDLGSREVLEEALGNYEGTVLVVSHDRYFLDSVARRILALENGRLIDFQGNYSQYVEHKKRFDTPEMDSGKEKRKRDYKEERRLKNLATARKRKIRELEERVESLEEEIEQMKKDQNDDVHADDWEKLSELAEKQRRKQGELDQVMWEYYELLEDDEAVSS